MSRLPEKGGRESKAFCDGVEAQLASVARDSNPFLAAFALDTQQVFAWNEGWQAELAPIAWTTATAYDLGEVVTSGGGLYTSRSPDGTVSGGTDPHLVLNAQLGTLEVNDGGVNWRFQGIGTRIDLGCCNRPPPTGVPVPYKESSPIGGLAEEEPENGVTLGPELLLNGGFDDDSVWRFVFEEWDILQGVAQCFGTALGRTSIEQAVSALIIGQTFTMTMDVLFVNAGSVRFNPGGAEADSSEFFTTTGFKTFTRTITSAVDTFFQIEASAPPGAFNGLVDNASLKQHI